MNDPSDWTPLLNEIIRERKIDFSQYHEALIKRRISVRMHAKKCQSYNEYLDVLKRDPDEMEELLNVLTINVTHFFRDPRVFEAIQKKILPEIFCQGTIAKKKIVRAWSCASSGGQEATSLLILMSEYLKGDLAKSHVHIYGTDVDKGSVQKARAGDYEDHEFKDMPEDLKKKYFVELENRHFCRKKELNKFLFFRQSDVIQDTPIHHVDLILCRNVFIYFERELQRLCLEKFHHALKPGGFLVLGLTEGILGLPDKRFEVFDRENRIYRKE